MLDSYLLFLVLLALISDPVQLAIIGGIAPTLVAMGTLIVSIKNSVKHNAADIKLDNIKTLADGTLTALRTELQAANGKIEGLQAMIHLLMESKTEFEKDYIKRKQEELESKVMQDMEVKEKLQKDLIKAKLSPPIDLRDL